MKSLERLPHSLIWDPKTCRNLVDSSDRRVFKTGQGAVASHEDAFDRLVIYAYVSVPSHFFHNSGVLLCRTIVLVALRLAVDCRLQSSCGGPKAIDV